VFELDKTQYHLVAHLTGGKIHYPEPESVIRGHSPGRVFVDRVSGPRAAFIYVRGQGGFYLLGDAEQSGFVAEVERLVDTYFAPYLQAQGISGFEFSADDPAWHPAIRAAFSGRELQSDSQHVYLLDRPRWKEVAARAQAVPIDAALLNGPLGNDQFLARKLQDCWLTYDEFSAHGLGSCVVCDGRVVSLCFSGYAADQRHAIVVETLPESRRRGFAKLAAAALLEQYHAQDIIAHWDVMPGNLGSIALAESLGFAWAYTYCVYYFSL
jgi:RimJ/RimL family protein N-acetyltransferase